MSAEIRRLLDMWRQEALVGDYGYAHAKTECANELDALLPALPPASSVYSREEFERDRMGETGDRLRAAHEDHAGSTLLPALPPDDPPAVEEDQEDLARVDPSCCPLPPAGSTAREQPKSSLRPIKAGTLGVPLALRREPTDKDFADPRFEVLWELMKRVDVDFRNGLFSGATGNDVCAVLDALGAVSRGDLSTEAPMQTDALEILRGIARRVKDRRCTLTLSLVDLDEIRACVSRASGAFPGEVFAVDPGAPERPQEPIRATLNTSLDTTSRPVAPRLPDETEEKIKNYARTVEAELTPSSQLPRPPTE